MDREMTGLPDEQAETEITDRLRRQMEFVLEADKLKEIGRQTYRSDGVQKENDAEHSWHLALMAFLLSEHANDSVDVLRVVEMVICHDLVEIDAGDTYAYDEAGKLTQRAREEKAAERLFGILPEDQARWMRDLWEEFEACRTPEARFARTLDRVQPILLNDATGGRAWREHQVRAEQIFTRNRTTHEGSEALWQYGKGLVEKNIEKGNIRKE